MLNLVGDSYVEPLAALCEMPVTHAERLFPDDAIFSDHLIGIDGVDGSGKTSLAMGLRERLFQLTHVEHVVMSGVSIPSNYSVAYQRFPQVYASLREALTDAESSGDSDLVQQVYIAIAGFNNRVAIDLAEIGFPVILDSTNLRSLAFNYGDSTRFKVALDAFKTGKLGRCFPKRHLRLDGDDRVISARLKARNAAKDGSFSKYDPQNTDEIAMRRVFYESIYNLVEQQPVWKRRVFRTYQYVTGDNTIANMIKFLQSTGYPPLRGVSL